MIMMTLLLVGSGKFVMIVFLVGHYWEMFPIVAQFSIAGFVFGPTIP